VASFGLISSNAGTKPGYNDFCQCAGARFSLDKVAGLVAEVGLRSGKRTSDCGVTNLMIPRKIADLTFECFECHTHE